MDPYQDLLNNDLQVTPATENYLVAAAKWGKFLAIVGFIFCGLMVVMSFLIGSVLSNYSSYATYNINPIYLTVLYIVLAIILFFPCFFLYKFSVKMQQAIKSKNQENLDMAFSNLKSLFKFYGIVTIITLSLYLLIFIVAIVSTIMRD
ncbi:MAG: hypothetical protein H0W12_08065 [Chitinophagaceae bacterium]|nr:hypothetical protein [Chitinophagaceae bacterium]